MTSKKDILIILLIVFLGLSTYYAIVSGLFITIVQSTKALIIMNGIYYVSVFVASMIAGYIIRKFIEPRIIPRLKKIIRLPIKIRK